MEVMIKGILNVTIGLIFMCIMARENKGEQPLYCVYCCCKPQFLHGIGAFILKIYENQRYVMELMVHLPLVDMKVIITFPLQEP